MFERQREILSILLVPQEVRAPRMLKRRSRDWTCEVEWDWETESKIWETCEEMERWAIMIRHRSSKCL